MVVFDMAGTTVHENNVVYKTLQKVINEDGYNFSLAQVLAEGAGKEKLQAIKDIIAMQNIAPDDAIANKIYGLFVDELATAYDSFELKPQPGAEETFQSLRDRNILAVLNTGYNEKTAVNILEKLRWETGKQIDGLITASDVQNNRPNPDMIMLAMQRFGIENASEVVKVGDSIIDIEEGKNAGCSLSIGITTGAHTYEQLVSANPDHIIHHLQELLPLI
ncbi:MAG: phosphonatase-like hydrolase [Ferruginibacter sp.]|nr:phosphonatase-like hydrolase [Ferruginibacter sp.]